MHLYGNVAKSNKEGTALPWTQNDYNYRDFYRIKQSQLNLFQRYNQLV